MKWAIILFTIGATKIGPGGPGPCPNPKGGPHENLILSGFKPKNKWRQSIERKKTMKKMGLFVYFCCVVLKL